MTCLIYCLEPEQNIEQNQKTYPKCVIKIGIQETENDNRIESYGKNSIVHFRILCENPREIENVMVSVFLENNIHLTKGREYFFDDINKIKTLFKETLKENLLEKDLKLFLFQEQLDHIVEEDNRIFYHITKINYDNTEFQNGNKILEKLKMENKIAKEELTKEKIQRDREKLEREREKQVEKKERAKQEREKQQMNAQSLPSPSRFLNYVKDHNDFLKNEIEANEYLAKHKSKLWSEVKSTTLFQAYNSWCEMTNDKKFTNQAFIPIVTKSHEKKRKKHGYVFDLSKLENKNEDN